MIDTNLLQDFIGETEEHLEDMEKSLMKLEADPQDQDLLHNIFRAIHTVKGAAELVGVTKIAELTHNVENLLESIRHGDQIINREIIDFLFQVQDRIAMLNDDLNLTQKEEADVADLIQQMDKLAQASNSESCQVSPEIDHPHETESQIRIPEEIPADHGAHVGEVDESSDYKAAANNFQNMAGQSENLSEHEVYEEDYDTELFDIFIDNLRENLTAIGSLTEDSNQTDDPHTLVGRCSNAVQSLRSSAKYMGYDKLSTLYEQWLEAVDNFARSDDFDSPSLRNMIEALTRRVLKFFPNVSGLQENFDADDLDETFDADGMADDSVEDAGESSGSPSHPSASEPESETINRPLFEKLGHAFDSTMKHFQSETASEQLDDMETRLFSGADPDTGIDTQMEPFSIDLDTFEAASKMAGRTIDPENQLFSKNPDPMVHEETEEDGSPIPSEKDFDAPAGDKDTSRKIPSKQTGEKVVKQSIRVEANKIDTLMNQAGELVVSRAWFSQLFNEMRGFERSLRKNHNLEKDEAKQVRSLTFRLSEATVALGRVAGELQENVMKVRMMPIAQLFNRYPRLIRELAHKTGKRIDLQIRGEDTELDKMIIEEISDPLIHIIRNAVDHGIEPTDERIRTGKPESGLLVLEAFHESNHVVIEITDDGRGIDTERIKTVARQRGFHTKEELGRMSHADLLDIILRPSFSTAAEVTHTSGRGVGMDVVRKNIEKLNGNLEIESETGLRTCIRIKIPLTLAIIPALLVRVGAEIYTIPLAAVEETLRINEHETSTLEGIEVIHLRENTLPLIRLAEVFKITSRGKDPNRAFVVVVNTGMRQVGFVVDELLGQEEVVIKPLVDYLQDKSGFSGATILGDGQISLILDTSDLVRLSLAKKSKWQGNPNGFTNSFEKASGAGTEMPVTG